MKKVSIIALLSLVVAAVTQAQKISSDMDFNAMRQPLTTKNLFLDSAYNIWCGSVIKGKNNKYYMLYSRWPRKNGHLDWVRHSEVALAVAEHVGGPYRHLKVVLPPRGSQYWDGVNTHNPYAIAYKGKYYLFYIGMTGTADLKQPATYNDPAWWAYRNTQRIGLAVADDPEGEWKRADKPIFDVNPDTSAFDAKIVSNPAVTINNKGKVILMYKAVERNGTLNGGKVKMGIAFADNILGPYKRHNQPILEPKNRGDIWMLAEDPFLWYSRGKYNVIVRDAVGHYTGQVGALALLTSTNAVDWVSAKHVLVAPSKINLPNGKLSDDRIERPFLWFENGMPVYLFGAMGINHRGHSMNIAIPLK